MLFMIRYKRKYGQKWHYTPTVYEGDDGWAEANKRVDISMKSDKFYAMEVVIFDEPTVVYAVKK